MKTKGIFLGVVVLCWVSAAMSWASDAQMGTWSLKGAKSVFAPGMGRIVSATFAPVGDKIQVTTDGTDLHAKETHGVWLGRFDGNFYPVKGDLDYDAVKYQVVNDRTMTMTTQKKGAVLWTGTITVSRNGQSRVLTISGKDAAGKKFKSKLVYTKQ